MSDSTESYKKEYRILNLRARREDVERWKEHAYKRRMSLSKLIRTLLDQDCDMSRTTLTTDGPVVKIADVVHVLPEKKVEKLAQTLVERAKSNEKCERRLPKGAFCKTCGRIHR